MASQPRLARVLLLGLVAGWLRAAQPRDFTVKDIVYLHPSSKHGLLLPKGIKVLQTAWQGLLVCCIFGFKGFWPPRPHGLSRHFDSCEQESNVTMHSCGTNCSQLYFCKCLK